MCNGYETRPTVYHPYLRKTKKFINRLQMLFHRQQLLLSYLKTLSWCTWWPLGWKTGAYTIELIGRRLIVKMNERTREF